METILAVNGSGQPKKESYQAQGKLGDEHYGKPAIIVSLYEEGKFIEDKLCTAPMILAEVDNYDDRSLALMLQELIQKTNVMYEEKAMDLVARFVTEFQKRIKARKEVAAKAQAEAKKRGVDNDNYEESSWEKQKKFYMGKSLSPKDEERILVMRDIRL